MANITKVTTDNREEWKELRSKYLGGSDASAAIGMNQYRSPYALWAEKTGRTPSFDGNLATEVGTYLEEFVAQKFASETGKKVRRANQSIFNSDYPWAIANIDRDIVGEDAGLEIKTTSELNLKKFKGQEFPEQYYCQCVHYMAVTGKKKWYLAVLIGNKEFKVYELSRDEEEIAALMKAERKFWDFVERNVAPYIDGSESTTKAINALNQDSNENTVDLNAYNSEIKQYLDFNKQIKELETMRDACVNRIKDFMGNSGKGTSDIASISWKTSTRSSFDSKSFLKDYPQFEGSKYFKNSLTRTFRVSEKG